MGDCYMNLFMHCHMSLGRGYVQRVWIIVLCRKELQMVPHGYPDECVNYLRSWHCWMLKKLALKQLVLMRGVAII